MRRWLIIGAMVLAACASSRKGGGDAAAGDGAGRDAGPIHDDASNEVDRAEAGATTFLCQQRCGDPYQPDHPLDDRCPAANPSPPGNLDPVPCPIHGVECYYCGTMGPHTYQAGAVRCSDGINGKNWVGLLYCSEP